MIRLGCGLSHCVARADVSRVQWGSTWPACNLRRRPAAHQLVFLNHIEAVVVLICEPVIVRLYYSHSSYEHR
jgi:hypothetical protein